jgi:hypothetical protein
MRAAGPISQNSPKDTRSTPGFPANAGNDLAEFAETRALRTCNPSNSRNDLAKLAETRAQH